MADGQVRNNFAGVSSGVVVQARDVHMRNTVAYPVPYQLPSDTAVFVGRGRHLDQLDTIAAAGRGTARLAVITGQPGIGKTALAVRWAHRAREQFPDGQLYTDLRGFDPTGEPVDWEDVLDNFLLGLGGPDLVIPTSLAAKQGLYHSMLSGRRVLVILDNAASADQVRPLVPGGPGCLVLVTSRNALPSLVARDGALRLTLDLLPTEHAVDFLTTVTGEHDIPATTITRLAELCEGLPLALRITAEHAANPGTQLDGFVGELTDERSRLDALAFSDDDAKTAVRAIFSWSYRALPAEAASMFRLLGLSPVTDLTVEAAAALAGTGVQAARKALSQLANAHLVDAHAGRFRSHDLLRAYARETAEAECTADERQAAGLRLLYWYLVTANRAEAMANRHYRALDPPEHPADVSPLTFASAEAAAEWHLAESTNLSALLRSITAPELRAAKTLLSTIVQFSHIRYMEHAFTRIAEAKDATIAAHGSTIESLRAALDLHEQLVDAKQKRIDTLEEMIEVQRGSMAALRRTIAAQQDVIDRLKAAAGIE